MEDRYKAMLESGRPLFQVTKDGGAIWEAYMSGFSEQEQQEHRCACCRNFIKAVGGIVTVDPVDLEITTLWDFRGMSDVPSDYLKAFDKLDAYVRSLPIEGLFHHTEPSAGADKSVDRERNVIWQHFRAVIPPNSINKDNKVGRESATLRDSKNVLLRSVREITMDAVDTVLEMTAQNTLYRGEEFAAIVKQLKQMKIQYATVSESDQDTWAWLQAMQHGPALSRARNTAIGTLLVDLSEGRDLESAVTAYERITAPTNYKRPTALVTPRMVEAAKARLTELGLISALSRRRLDERDLTVANALFIYRPTTAPQDVFAQLKEEKTVDVRSLNKVEEIHIDRFLSDVLPTAKSLRLLVEHHHLGNFVTLTGPQDPDAKNIMKWDNSYAWSYTGGLADSIKERVKAAGGKVDGWLRASLAWYNFDDLDLHFYSDREHVYYSERRGREAWLDVDMNAGSGTTREPVENITVDNQLKPGNYKIAVKQYSRRENNNTGYQVEIEVNGDLHRFSSNKSPDSVDTITFKVLEDGQVIVDGGALTRSSSGMTKWGIKTGQFVPVHAVTLSPNFWTRPVTNKHYMFLLQGCISDEATRPFLNEFLTEELAADRKTMEALSGKIEVAPATSSELSGVGFSSTKRAHVYVEVESSFKRHLKILF